MESYTKNELAYNGMIDTEGKLLVDGDTGLMLNMVKELMSTFYSDQYASIDKDVAIEVFQRLLKNIPISPLTGGDDEWVDIGDELEPLWKNSRCSTVLKDANGAWDTSVYINLSWVKDASFNGGVPFKMYFVAENQKVPIKFPYDKGLSLKEVFVPTEEFPSEEI